VREIFNKIAFIVFNYDRCIEIVLLNALQTDYGIREQEAKCVIGELEIIHPCGVIELGRLLWAHNFSQAPGGR
jgi:hypothetical protein